MTRHSRYFGLIVLFGCAFETPAGLLGAPVTTDDAAPIEVQRCGSVDSHYWVQAPHSPLAAEVIGTLQRALAERNYYQGAVDGVAGEQTAEAIFLFQMDCELPLTGSINAEILKRLNIRSPLWLSE
ncbi:peptidoglycan-binding domain-containing protein [Pseudomonas sp. Fl4BN1]|uniref:peptidoglycan-binding domain-containing protein n=1 Tax=Pseudomonas sp. Fl4BN1 TaxID=2697651 RepID=UPI001377D527|nr:peptidoglycan-binding domain-containing protein [Pseudomonas sp. Fl4BN1]NBF12656.1 hypothetical protein [Pseudomonas sp. Fl4BN1]